MKAVILSAVAISMLATGNASASFITGDFAVGTDISESWTLPSGDVDRFIATAGTDHVDPFVSVTDARVASPVDDPVQAVPEPTTLLLLGAGLAGVAGRAARRRKTRV